MPKILKRAASAVALPGSTSKRTKIAPVTPRKNDYISSLPLELLQEILKHLPPATYIPVKFVSRTLNAATWTTAKVPDLRGFKGTNILKLVGCTYHRAFNAGVIALEAAHPTPLPVLTCSNCGRRYGHSIYGFCDDHFDQKLLNRRCVECRYPRWYVPTMCVQPPVKVNNVVFERCLWCLELYVLPRRGTRACQEVGIHRCGYGRLPFWVDELSTEYDVPRMEGRIGKRVVGEGVQTGLTGR